MTEKMRSTYSRLLSASALASVLVVSSAVLAQDLRPSMSTYGTPGLVEMPTAEVLRDGELAFTSSIVGPTVRNSITFQVLPNIYGTFRYSSVDGLFQQDESYFDRSFDVHVQLAEEDGLRPAVAFGLRDLLGTGIYSGEYIVATKSFGPRVEVTGGIGWGRFAGRDTFSNPFGVFSDRFDTRPGGFTGTGGQLETGNWFRGPAAIFGGVKWHVNDRTTVFAEYSTDVQAREANAGIIDISSPLNVGVEYRFRNGIDLKAYVVGGNEIGAQLSYVIDPAQRRVPGGREPGPQPLGDRDRLAYASWNDAGQGGGRAATQAVLNRKLAAEGMGLQGFTVDGRSATVRVENNRWDVEAQAAGRAARAMATTLAPEVEELRVVFQQDGVPVSRIVTSRSDLERFEYDYDGAWRTYARARIEDAHDEPVTGRIAETYPSFDYSLTPYLSLSFFDPQSPLRAEVGPQLRTTFRPAPGWTFTGSFRYPLVGNIDEAERESDSVLPRVRTDGVRYAQESDFEINRLTADYRFRPGKDLFGRVTAGYLEEMFGGVSAELLWYPIGSRLALGAEVNYARQRDFDMLLGFQDYDIVTGHASAYYDLGHGFHAQVDAGRYLAGDWGATFALDREFNNGFRVGGFFTLTDVSSEDFGEGSFDKGIRFEVPLSWITGKPSQTVVSRTIRPVQRDGGARLNVDNRLYRSVRDYRAQELRDGWGRYLR